MKYVIPIFLFNRWLSLQKSEPATSTEKHVASQLFAQWKPNTNKLPSSDIAIEKPIHTAKHAAKRKPKAAKVIDTATAAQDSYRSHLRSRNKEENGSQEVTVPAIKPPEVLAPKQQITASQTTATQFDGLLQGFMEKLEQKLEQKIAKNFKQLQKWQM